MKKYSFYKGFTLVELMIVIAIIGILTAVLYPMMTGYFERARDTAKKQNIRQLNLALTSFAMDHNTYKIPNVGYFQNGKGFINFLEPTRNGGTPYILTMDKALRDMGYTTLQLKTLYIKDMVPTTSSDVALNRTECFASPAHKDMYMFNFDENSGKYAFFTFLERSTKTEKEDIQNNHLAMGEDGACSRWGMNYSITN